MKRRRQAKPGELMVYYGRLPHNNPDILVSWGEGVPRADASLAMHVLTSERVQIEYGGNRDHSFISSFVDELVSRGYDITTLQFYIRKMEATNGTK